MMKGEQRKIFHKGSIGKINAFITLLYPLNKIKFKISKSRTSTDFIDHLSLLEAIAIYCKERKMILRREHCDITHYNSFKSFTIGSITSVGKGPIPMQVRVFGSICVFPASCMNAK